jgi:hypothetical protein
VRVALRVALHVACMLVAGCVAVLFMNKAFNNACTQLSDYAQIYVVIILKYKCM